MKQRRQRLKALRGGDEFGSDLPPFCGAAMGNLTPDRDQTRKLNGQETVIPVLDTIASAS